MLTASRLSSLVPLVRCVRSAALLRRLSASASAPVAQASTSGAPSLNLFGMAPSQLKDLFTSLKKPAFRAQQVVSQMYGPPAISGIDSLTNLSKDERSKLSTEFVLDRGSIEAEQVSSDGTRKWTVRLPAPADPSHRVECVFIPDAGAGPSDEDAGEEHDSGDEGDGPAGGHGRVIKGTLCVSSQAGCSLACSFCHTGTQKLEGNLTQAGIYAQFALAQQRLAAVRPHGLGIRESSSPSSAGSSSASASSPRYRISNVVFMGQGEPFYNWRAVKGAVGLLTDPHVGGLAPRRLTISTAGVAPLIPKIALETPDVRLAVSLHAANDELRTRIMGINRSFPLAQLMGACQRYLGARLAYVEAARTAAKEFSQGQGQGQGRDSGYAGSSRAPGGAGSAGKSSAAATPAAAAAAAGGSAARAALDSYDHAPPDLRALRRQHDMLADWHSSRWRSRITFEYVLLRGVNDSPAHADELRALLAQHLPAAACHVNLLPFHPWPGAPYEPSPPEAILEFQRRLQMPRAGSPGSATGSSALSSGGGGGGGAASVDLRATVAGDSRSRAASEYGRHGLAPHAPSRPSYMPSAAGAGSGSRPAPGARARGGGGGGGAAVGGSGLQCHVRRSRGLDILGACGQLKSSEEAKGQGKSTASGTAAAVSGFTSASATASASS